jgi:hypothetical protein
MANDTHVTLGNDWSPTSPIVEITNPQHGIAISPTTANTFKGQVSDVDDETLPNASLSWTLARRVFQDLDQVSKQHLAALPNHANLNA